MLKVIEMLLALMLITTDSLQIKQIVFFSGETQSALTQSKQNMPINYLKYYVQRENRRLYLIYLDKMVLVVILRIISYIYTKMENIYALVHANHWKRVNAVMMMKNRRVILLMIVRHILHRLAV